MQKFDAKKIKSGDLRGFWIDFLAVPGGKGGGRYLKYRIDSNNLTRSPPRRGAADKNGSPNRCKIHENLPLAKKCVFFGINFRYQFSDVIFSGIFQILDGFWLPFWIRRTPPGSRVSNYYNQSGIFWYLVDITPRHGQKIDPKWMKKCGCRTVLICFDFFLVSNFGINFRIPFFPVFFRFWMDFGSHFGCILVSFSILFASLFRA